MNPPHTHWVNRGLPPVISCRMRHGLTLPGQQRPDDDRWYNDTLSECHWDDRLWGYASRVSEQLRTRTEGDFTNPVLFQLLFMGTYDWDHENRRNNQSTQAMRHSTVMGSRLYDAHRSLTAECHRAIFFPFFSHFSPFNLSFPSIPAHLKTEQDKTIQIRQIVRDYTGSHHRDLAGLQGCLSIAKGFVVLISIVVVFGIQDVIGVLSHHPWR